MSNITDDFIRNLKYLLSCNTASLNQSDFGIFPGSCITTQTATTKTVIERFSNDCRKTKTKAIFPTNHNRKKQHDEPITVPSNYLQLAQSAGIITRTWCDWFWFYFSLVENLRESF